MLSKFKNNLSSILTSEDTDAVHDRTQTASVAATALLLEAAQADDRFDQSELHQIEQTLATVLSIDATRIKQTLELGQENLDHATCLHELTSTINQDWDLKSKIELIEALWKVVLTDQRIDPNEQHLMRKIKGLLHIPQSEYIAAKLRARDSLQ